MAFDEGLAQRVREMLVDRSGLDEKKMFGGLSFLLQGNMACGIIEEDLIVRVGPHNYEEALAHDQARPFDFTGRVMTSWVMVGPEGYEDDGDLQAWVQRGLDFAGSLPPK